MKRSRRQRAAERAYTQQVARSLDGVCFACKDFHAVEGRITTYGSKVFRDDRPTYTTPYVRRLLDAGAIMMTAARPRNLPTTPGPTARCGDRRATPGT
ncbi:amidase family protein [Bradyrhizobium neotropicale]|uniref:amidase family protein n=1 Tax=Bradyrhizobium neotropicale TaxID=1497615 RepID=UPI00390812F3